MPRPPRRTQRLLALALAAVVLVSVRCWASPRPQPDSAPALATAGTLMPIAAPVVRWDQPGGYDAYREAPWFAANGQSNGGRRYSTRSCGPDLAALQKHIHLLVLHYDAAGTAARCFQVLHDERRLSVHFLLDVDGTLYQTLDLREKAAHATIANDAAVGVEIAHPGAFARRLGADMRRFYEQDEHGFRLRFPKGRVEPGIRTPNFVGRPDRPEPIAGTIHGQLYHQFDFTPQQYRSLAALCAALSQALPRIRLEAPRDPKGAVTTTALSEAELRRFDGIVGHYHVQANKQDPGPALQWDRLLREARNLARTRP
ncbi:MAG: N-acetylmuramoyl-L-alanine amidase [Planctomycetes bacterium]|nr:N-acetylmuramoyl-L-alanine amidase [Planctomycetota bacterium]